MSSGVRLKRGGGRLGPQRISLSENNHRISSYCSGGGRTECVDNPERKRVREEEGGCDVTVTYLADVTAVLL